MLTIGDFIKLILKKRGITLVELAEMMTKYERINGNNQTVFIQHLSTELKTGKISVERARKIEIVLKLPDFQLVNMISSNITPKKREILENIYKNRLENE